MRIDVATRYEFGSGGRIAAFGDDADGKIVSVDVEGDVHVPGVEMRSRRVVGIQDSV